ncbi:cyclin-dependent kinase inhibitor 3 family protein [Rhodoferax antarcticus]|uniref:protein-tyrosine-phosphatase n=1 Tax=Rhodoferax antarcticus ANT.BR TaxID=1111071 RepID=A0A1Q8YII6_9BURK|nr:cyclin-dependent kinase inhibitor 3 family protein [Rhodoferax antarcticus]OLP07805.1 putative protein-tyrosine phosphatase [Rhodoferax antarcticus ANT.BR]
MKSLEPENKQADMQPPTASGHRVSPRVRTSASDPLRINEVPAGQAGGLIGITFCPGKCGESLGGARWQRDLGADLDVIAQWRPAAVVTLIEDHEFEMLRVTELGSQVQARAIAWYHMPIVDVRPPDARFEAAWLTSGPQLLEILRAGARVLVHCRGGLGRAGTVAARLLVELGVPPTQAIERVRRARPGAIETAQQRAYVLNLPRGEV